jgi:uncharacterized protein YbdZ (MbtH family)
MKQNHEPDSFDPFDPENLRIDQSYLSQPAAKKLLTTVPVRKPHKQDFIRVHPAEVYRLNAALVELHDERETYLVLTRFISELGEGEYFVATLYLCVNRQKVLSVWPVKMPPPNGRETTWHTSAADAAKRAMKTWIRVGSNMGLGAYEAYEAVQDFGEPEWPELSFPEILRIAFKGRVIEGPDHLVIKKLRGMA